MNLHKLPLGAFAITAAIWLFGCAHASHPVMQDGRYREEFRHAFSAEGITTLEIENARGKVSVRGVEGADEIVVAGTKVSRTRSVERAREEIDGIDIDAVHRRSTVVVRTHYPTALLRNSRSYVEYEVTAPPAIAARISCASADVSAESLREADIHTASGDVVVKDIETLEVGVASGSVHIERFESAEVSQASGDITAVGGERIKVSGASGDVVVHDIQRVRVSLASGNVSSEQCDSVAISTASGDVSAVAMKDASVKTASGDITTESQEEPSSLNLESLSGGIHVMLPASSSIVLEASTTSGRIRVIGMSLEDVESDRTLLRGSHAGGEAPVKLRTVSGDVRIEAR